jgi:hypothetical protein
MDLSDENVRRAFEAIERARRLANAAGAASTELQRDLIAAASLRFASEPSEMAAGPARDRLNARYADAMEKLCETYAQDNWILLFGADAEMNTAPWNYWEEPLPAGMGKTLRSRAKKAEEYVRTILQRDPKNLGALHLEIHLFEAAHDYSRALEASEAMEKVFTCRLCFDS